MESLLLIFLVVLFCLYSSCVLYVLTYFIFKNKNLTPLNPFVLSYMPEYLLSINVDIICGLNFYFRAKEMCNCPTVIEPEAIVYSTNQSVMDIEFYVILCGLYTYNIKIVIRPHKNKTGHIIFIWDLI